MASRSSYLIYSDNRAPAGEEQSAKGGEVLYSSSHGVPVVWLFCFGGRNVWDPGDDVQARGGAVGQRNIYETPVEVALTRLTQAQDALRDNPHVWPWLSAMPILARKLSLHRKSGFIRLVAPWVEQLPQDERDRWRSATAFVENFVNFLAANRRTEAAESIRRLAAFCPFVPEGHAVDAKNLTKCHYYQGEDRAMCLALLTLGEPQVRDLFERAVEHDVLPALEVYDGLTPLAAPNSSLVKVPTAPAAAPEKKEQKAGGIMGKLTGLFGKKEKSK